MSALYNLEPQPTASAIIHTTLGEILVELFAKQTPLTCRNFLQLSLDGYYDGAVFHRLVPNFILQGGDPTGTGNGGESIYDGGAFSDDLDPWPMDQRRGRNAGPTGIHFKDEFHSRLKFNRRGLLAMANDGRPDTNGSQFFFTLDKTEELSGKNTLFGRVAGDTIYNLAKIGESEVEEGSERPLYAVKIERIEVLVNPFEDMAKRSRVATRVQPKAPAAKDKKKKRKGGKQLLSFGDEEGDEEVPVFKKTKFDTRLIAGEEADEERPRDKKSTNREPAKVAKPPKTSAVDLESQVGETVSHVEPKPVVDEEANSRPEPEAPSREPSPEPEPVRKSALQKAQEEMAALKASMRRTVHSEQAVTEKEKSALESLIPETSIRGRKRRPVGNNTLGNEDTDTVRMLRAFQSRLEKAPPEKETARSSNAQDGEGSGTAGDEAEVCDLHFIANCQSCTAWDKQEEEDSDDEGWMSHSLSFAAEKLGKDLSYRKKAEEELVVIDPREKARTLKEEKQAQREARAGGSGRAWDQGGDQARNAKLARAASLAGRGAR
ncbi:hypothetical protein G6O67_002859 [Ophiocordyceps sinensis]|uniref:peptidylprolyl isomerase n=2 Tax=Ophiocordyceps sinensis TaxID=72228 RepID=A0A8H4PV87_9HYPO|nr:peptidyl-prolyl isomerase CWC27 [Ophiocordyceps sinensis CO18]KAF4511021.1 hypothetical protein G6O67_002859 [Ophiocordyceps sinensis]